MKEHRGKKRPRRKKHEREDHSVEEIDRKPDKAEMDESKGQGRQYHRKTYAVPLVFGEDDPPEKEFLRQRGKNGGYRLVRPSSDYTLGEILRAVEGNLAPVSCLDCTSGELCPKIENCTTVDIWRDLGKVTSAFLDSKSLSDLIGPDGADSCA